MYSFVFGWHFQVCLPRDRELFVHSHMINRGFHFFCIGFMLVKECGKDRMFIGFFCWIWSPDGAIVGLVWLILAYSFILGIGSLTWFVRK